MSQKSKFQKQDPFWLRFNLLIFTFGIILSDFSIHTLCTLTPVSLIILNFIRFLPHLAPNRSGVLQVWKRTTSKVSHVELLPVEDPFAPLPH